MQVQKVMLKALKYCFCSNKNLLNASHDLKFFFVLIIIDVTSCVIKGDRNPHPINSSFITSDCTLQCYCSVSGVVSCMELCPQASPVQCPPGSELYEDEVPVGSGGVHCSCKRQYCVPLNGTFWQHTYLDYNKEGKRSENN